MGKVKQNEKQWSWREERNDKEKAIEKTDYRTDKDKKAGESMRSTEIKSTRQRQGGEAEELMSRRKKEEKLWSRIKMKKTERG